MVARRTAERSRGRRKARSAIRIGAGRWKGRALEVAPGARPTSARAREALFDLLRAPIAGARVLDLYAGSGAVGLEALSRGARSALLVERDAEWIERSLSCLGVEGGGVRLARADASRTARELAGRGESFDLIFCDPPYGEAVLPDLAESLARLLASTGELIFQRDGTDPPPAIPGLSLTRRRVYGRNVFYFFEHEASPPFDGSTV